MINRFKQKLPSIILLFILFYTTICLILYFQQERLMFAPSKKLVDNPASYQLPYEDVWIDIVNQEKKTTEKIHGWWMPNSNENANVFVYMHHNAINVSVNITQAKQFYELGYSVFLFDYRGFGQSKGDFPTESQVYEDAQAAWQYLTQTREISPSNIIIYGHSIGGAVAIDLASKQPSAKALIVHNSFTSMKDMTKRFALYNIFPMELILRNFFKSEQKIRTIAMPKLIIAGTKDIQIPYNMGEQLYKVSPQPKELMIIDGANHDNHMAIEDLLKLQSFIDKS